MALGDHQPLAPLPTVDSCLPRGALSTDAHEIAHVSRRAWPRRSAAARSNRWCAPLDDAVRIRRMRTALEESSTSGRRAPWACRTGERLARLPA